LNGADPENVLCLTYTKAGAAEMARRIQDSLARFASLPHEILALELENLLGRPPDAIEIARARGGLLDVLELPAGLRIMTIHSFCQSLLRRFPLEAGVSPHFELMEPRAAATLLQRARDEVLIDRDPAIRDAVEKLAVQLGEHSLGEGLSALNAKRAEFTRWLEHHTGDVEAAIADVYAMLGVEPGITLDDLYQKTVDDPAIDEPGLASLASALWNGTDKTDIPAAQIIGSWLEANPMRRLAQLPDYRLVFLKKDGDPRANLPTASVKKAHPHVQAAFEAEQARLIAWADREKALRTVEKTSALIRVGAAIIQVYERRKRLEGFLDYADLVDKSLSLLSDAEAADWVRYKLDQRIDHLLIDESQDTSPDQWQIIEALIDDFFSGENHRDQPPTLFVVGDEKQSIFGFQGADVETFKTLRKRLKTRADSAGLTFKDAPLDRSFRSARTILQAVDSVFADAKTAAGVQGDGQALKHEAFDHEKRGLVEVWPLVDAEKPAPPEPWALPDRKSPIDNPERRLAQVIALQIQSWLRDGAKRAGKDEPIQPGDIMILLPRRGVLQDFLVRELKRNHVPVAGADRMALTDELAVMDLMALGDALLLPEDDLTVATLLRSPLFGFTDQQLLTLAHDRGDRPIYRRLQDLSEEDPAFADADARFRSLLAKVDYVPPYEFFASFLCEGAPSGRQRLLKRLGPAAILPIEAFLAQAVAFERGHPPSMQGFLHWLRADTETIKRDAQETSDEVRILTVHGSKGLEAPIVFLADATYQKSTRQDRLLWHESGLPIWKVAEKEREPFSQAIADAEEKRQQAEHRRLLYVAMTRAEERLIVAGCRRSKETAKGPRNWYDMIKVGIERLPGTVVETETLPGGVKGDVWRFGDGRASQPASGQAMLPFLPHARSGAPMPEWLASAARGEIRAEAVRPSEDPLSEDPPALSPLSHEGERRFGRGLLIHKLLQILPDLPASDRMPTMRRYLEKPGLGLPRNLQNAIVAEVESVLEAPGWAALFGPTSRAEVALVGSLKGQRVSGQVDRLAVIDDTVLVVDYKTNRPAPRAIDDVPAVYGRQMAMYRSLLRQIYPEKKIACALLWTEQARLMTLDEHWLDGFDLA
jgi:ATP-dependent helicase/nuclease subunit A